MISNVVVNTADIPTSWKKSRGYCIAIQHWNWAYSF